MQPPEKPKSEAERLHTLRALKILDSSHEERFDRVTRMAMKMFDVPVSLVTLIDEDRQWFKSSQGVEVTETPRDISFCGHAINQDDVFVIADTLEDDRFLDNPFVTANPNIRFYAGYPLQLRTGINLGTLCILDTKPRTFSESDKGLLKDFGTMIEQEIKSMQWATLDELTMLYSRRGFFTLAEHTRKLCIRKKMAMTFIFFDLDEFKLINDHYGHQEGDYVLIEFTQTMQKTFRESDILGRLGGDEFVMMLSGTDMDEVNALLSRFNEAVIEMNLRFNKRYSIKFSAGAVSFPYDTKLSLDDMIAKADSIMYVHKNVS